MSWDRLEAARRLSTEPTDAIVRLLVGSESEGAGLPLTEISRISRLVDEAAARLAHGGTLHLAAAGPVGHLVRFVAEETASWFPGVLPITVLAAEADGAEEEAIAIVDRTVKPDDVVLCVSRSGTRSWTIAVARKSNMIGALVASVTCAPDSPVSRESDIPVVLPAGPDVVMGSTQYRAGTAVKVALDAILLSLAVRAGGLWGDVPVAADTGADSWRLVAAAAGVDHLQARSVLARSGGDAMVAIVMAKLGLDEDEARQRLAAADRHLEDVIGRP